MGKKKSSRPPRRRKSLPTVKCKHQFPDCPPEGQANKECIPCPLKTPAIQKLLDKEKEAKEETKEEDVLPATT